MSTNATVLYDAPGPKARKLYGGIAVASIIIFIAIVVYVLVILGQNGQLEGEKWSPFLKGTTWTTYILPGLVGTIVAGACCGPCLRATWKMARPRRSPLNARYGKKPAFPVRFLQTSA